MGVADIDGRTDLYALGCILFELIAGRAPFASDDPYGELNYTQMMKKHVEETPPRVNAFGRECPAQLAILVERLLAKSPADRPASAAEVAATLQAIIADPEIKPSLGTDALGDVSVQSQSLTERLRESAVPERDVNWQAMVAVLVVTLAVVIAAAIWN